MLRDSCRAAVGIGASFLFAAAAGAADPPASRSHAHSLSGTVASVDGPGHSLTVRDSKGKEMRITTTAATRVSGDKLEPGAKVTVRWMIRDHRNVATAVLVHAPEAERTASVTPSSPLNPTPRAP